MDEAKVVINLKEGVIELQGPVDFVQRYMDAYQLVAKGPEGVTVTPKEAEASLKEELAMKAAKKRASYKTAIRDALEEGFFDKPRSPRDVKQKFEEAGVNFTDSGVRAILRRLSLAGVLKTVKEGGAVRYQKIA